LAYAASGRLKNRARESALLFTRSILLLGVGVYRGKDEAIAVRV
jgi:hypothetical protein